MRHCKFEKKTPIYNLYLATEWNCYNIKKYYELINCHSLMWLVWKTKLNKNKLNEISFYLTTAAPDK